MPSPSGNRTEPEFLPPQQARSSHTLDRILGATRALLRDRDFEDITMADIAEHAGVSVGNLYNRFRNKDELLRHILNDFQARQATVAAEHFGPGKHAGLPLGMRIESLVASGMLSVEQQKNPLRAILVRTILDREAMTEADRRNSAELVDLLGGWLAEAKDEITHPEPETAARAAVMMMSVLLQYPILIGAPVNVIGQQTYYREVKRALRTYLGLSHDSEAPLECQSPTAGGEFHDN